MNTFERHNSREWGWTRKVSVLHIGRRLSGMQYNALCMAVNRVSKETFGTKGRKNSYEWLAVTSDSEKTVVYLQYYPVKRQPTMRFEYRVAVKLDKYFDELQKYL